MTHSNNKKFVIETQMGFVRKSDGHPSEPHNSVLWENDPDKAMTFVSNKTARRWADAYGLCNYSVHTLEHAREQVKASKADQKRMRN